MEIRATSKRSQILFVALALLSGMTAGNAGTLTVLKSFQSNTPNEWWPLAGLVMDASGNVYGTASVGGNGAYGPSGAAFKLAPDGVGGYSYSKIYDFCSQISCADGGHPKSVLVVDTSGNLYGTTPNGGANGHGVIFKLTLSGGTYSVTVLHNFCSSTNANGYCSDGDDHQTYTAGLSYAGASSGTPYDGTSPLYGVTGAGGTNNQGIAFKLTHSGSTWTLTNIYNFCTKSGSGSCSDGGGPMNTLMVSSSDLYGVTFNYGGATGSVGVVYKLSPSFGSSTYTQTTVRTFCCSTGSLADGRTPNSSVVFDGSGNLLGTTCCGGSYANASNGAGVYYLLKNPSIYGTCSHDGLTGEWCLGSVYAFCPNSGDTDCASQGMSPSLSEGVLQNGGIFGELSGDSGPGSYGKIFKFPYSTSPIVYTFCQSTCSDGAYPIGGLIADSYGNLLGVASGGGSGSAGTIFSYAP